MAWRKIELLAVEARTATATSAKQYTPNIERAIFFINATASAATPSVVPTVRGHTPDPAATAEDTWDILTGAAVTGTGNTALQIGPGLTEVNNVVAADNMPPEWDFKMTAADADSLTYGVSAYIFERD